MHMQLRAEGKSRSKTHTRHTSTPSTHAQHQTEQQIKQQTARGVGCVSCDGRVVLLLLCVFVCVCVRSVLGFVMSVAVIWMMVN